MWFRKMIQEKVAGDLATAASKRVPVEDTPTSTPNLELIQAMLICFLVLNSIALLVLHIRGWSKSPRIKRIKRTKAATSTTTITEAKGSATTPKPASTRTHTFHDPHLDGLVGFVNTSSSRNPRRRMRESRFRMSLARSTAFISQASVRAFNAAAVTGSAARTSVIHASGFHMLHRKSTTLNHKRETAPHKVVTSLTLTFIVVILVAYVASRHFVAMSTWDFFPKYLEMKAALHILSALVWTVASAILTIKGFFRHHRRVGYVAVATNIAMSITAYSLAFSVFEAATAEYPMRQFDWDQVLEKQLLDLRGSSPSDWDWHTINSIYHSYSNMQIAGLSPMLLGYALVAARCHDKATHERFMGTIHLLMGTSLLPRVNAVWLRWLLPNTWSGHAIYSISISIQWSLNFYHIGPMPTWLLSQATPIERVQRRLIWQVFLANVYVAIVNSALMVFMYIFAEYSINVWIVSAVTTVLFMYSGMSFYKISGDAERGSLLLKRRRK